MQQHKKVILEKIRLLIKTRLVRKHEKCFWFLVLRSWLKEVKSITLDRYLGWLERHIELAKKVIKNRYLFSAFKESRGQALRDPLDHQFVLKMTHFWDKWVPEEPVPVPHPKR